MAEAPDTPAPEAAINLTGYVVIGLVLAFLIIPVARFHETMAWSYATLSWFLDGMDASVPTRIWLLDKALTWNPHYAWAQAEKGYAYLEQANQCQALTEFQAALKLTESGEPLHQELQNQIAALKCVPIYVPSPPNRVPIYPIR